jgi:hypothetical protein
MSCRKWLVRGLVFTAVAALTCAGWAYQRWTSPSVVRQQVMNRLQALFPSSAIALESAHMRLLGGIAISELRLVRRDDASHTDFAYVPSARIYLDKEMLLGGKLALRKVELPRPRLRLVREKDGHWNWAGLLAQADPRIAVPTLVIDDGMLLIVDRLAPRSLPPLEISHVKLTLVNDPLSTITIAGLGQSEMLGKVQFRATLRRDTHQATLRFQADGIALTEGLVSRLACLCPSNDLTGLSLVGTADLQASVQYRPGSSEPLTYDVSLNIHDGKLQHPRLPLTLEHLQAAARCANGKLTLERLTARAGPAEISAQATGLLPCVAANLSGSFNIKHLPVTRELCARLPWNLTKLYDALRPNGQLSALVEFNRDNGQWRQRHCLMRPEGGTVLYDRFRYPVEQITGTLDLDLGERLLKIDVAGYGGPQPVFLQGSWKGTGLAADVRLDLQADGVAVDEKLINALPAAQQHLARSFHPAGRADLTAHIRHVPGAATYANTYQVRFHDAFVKWDGFPYPVGKVTGTLVLLPDHWEFRDFSGIRNGAEIHVRGNSFPRQQGALPSQECRVVIEIEGKNVGIDSDLREALQPIPGLAKAWDNFRPRGRMSFQARVDRMPGRPQDMDIGVEVKGCSVLPVFFSYALQDLGGQFRFKGNRLQFSQLRASHGAARLSIDQGTVDVSPRGAYYVVLDDVWADPVVPDRDFVEALPQKLGVAVTALKLHNPFKLWARKVVVSQDEVPGSRPSLWWEGQMHLDHAHAFLGVDAGDVTGTLSCIGLYDGQQLRGLAGNVELTRATVLKQPFENVHSHFHIDEKAPGILVIDLNKAPLYGGDLSGQARLEFGSTLRYDLNLTASQIDMKQLGRQNLGPQSELAGQAWARLYLTGQGEGVRSLDGNGSFHVPRGKLYNLPFLSDLLKVLGLRWPDRTFFDEAHADFSIHGHRLLVDRLDLWGGVLSLSGRGALNLDGTDVALDFYPSWGPMEQLLPPAVRTVSPALSKSLLKIEMRGKVGGQPGELQFHKKPIPVLVDPLLHLRDRVVKGENKQG